MILDLTTSPLKQKPNTNRFSLNTVTNPTKLGSDANELGTILCTKLLTSLAGQPVLLDRDRFLFFLKDNSLWIVNTTDCTATLHAQLSCFGWDVMDTDLYPVTGTYRKRLGCEDIVYFFDGVNRDKFVNLSRPEKQKTNGIFDCSKFELNVDIAHPTIDTTILNSGGNLEYGTYNFSVEFLTANEDSLFISPVDINYTPITYNDEGALNISTNLAEIGGRPKSNQSIRIEVSDIPEFATLMRILVFRNITGDGSTSSSHAIGELIPITDTTATYTYRGYNVDNGDFLIEKNKYLQSRVVYQSSIDGIQVNNRLVRYNLKEVVRDYSNYQEHASKICAKYVVKEINKNDPDIHLLNRTLLGGEIILPAIVYIHADGTVSNAYPLVNREKNSFGEVLVDDINEAGTQVEKWKLYDTSIKDTTPITGYVSSGEFGYYESEQLYSNPPNFCNTDYWGNDCNDNPLQDTPVRLFVVPDRSVEPHEDETNIRPIGIWFDETTVEYPNDDVVGHYFTISVVEQSNIEAKGIGITDDLIEDGDGINQYIQPSMSYPAPANTLYYKFISGEGTINDSYIDGDYVSNEGYWDYDKEEEDQLYKKIFASGLPYDQIHILERDINNTGYGTNPVELSKLEKSYKIQSGSVIDNIENRNFTNSFDHLEISEEFTTTKYYRYLSIKNNFNPIPNIFNFKTRRITNFNEYVSFEGDNFISPLNVDSIHNFKIEGFNGLDLAIRIIRFGPFAAFIGNEGKDLDAYVDYLYGFYTESKVNTYLRHVGTDNCNRHLQKREQTFDYFLDKMIEPFNDNYKLRERFCPFFGGYNKDYSYISQYNRYRNISFTFDFCSDCVGLHPNLIVFSQQSFADDLADGYRTLLANDSVTIPADTGAIIKIDFKDNKLVVRTERSCYFLQPNPQQMETSEGNVYIGTGDFLSIPAQELTRTQPGYGGQQHKLDSINLGDALIWVDRRSAEIHKLGGSYEKLEQSLETEFRNKLPNVQHLIFGYDPINKRMLMTGKNKWTISYCFKEKGWKSWHSYIPKYYIYNTDNMWSVLDNNLWEHNKGKYTTYYNLKFPHIIERVYVQEGQTFLPQSIIYHANVYDMSNGYDRDVLNSTYDQMIAYNDIQSTGLQNLILNADYDIYYDPIITHVKQTDRNYKISSLKDLASSPSIWNINITSILQGTQGYMDKLPVVNFNKPEVEIGDFRGKWVCVRFIYNQHDYQIVMEFEQVNKQLSIR